MPSTGHPARNAALVFGGGALGTGARIGIAELTGSDVSAIVVNLVGAFFLGYVTARVARSSHPRRREVQLLVGTGLLGGFTTYSALAVHALDSWFMLWALGTVVGGFLAAWVGIALGRNTGPSSNRATP